MSAGADQLSTFVLEGGNVRGGLVSLGDTWQRILARHDYPAALAGMLGEVTVASVLMASHLKGQTGLSVQITGDGPIRLMVVQCNPALKVRAMAHWRSPLPAGGLLTGGRLTVTLEPVMGERYQGIVPLVGSSISQSLDAYFQRSEQLPTQLWLWADEQAAAGLLLQSIPSTGGVRAEGDGVSLPQVLAALPEINEPDLTDPEQFIQQYLGSWDVRLQDPRPVSHDCRCTPGHLGGVVRLLGETEVNSLLSEQRMVELNCEFCNRVFRYGPEAAQAALSGSDIPAQQLH
jgi:molecular chaperone Hsp33